MVTEESPVPASARRPIAVEELPHAAAGLLHPSPGNDAEEDACSSQSPLTRASDVTVQQALFQRRLILEVNTFRGSLRGQSPAGASAVVAALRTASNLKPLELLNYQLPSGALMITSFLTWLSRNSSSNSLKECEFRYICEMIAFRPSAQQRMHVDERGVIVTLAVQFFDTRVEGAVINKRRLTLFRALLQRGAHIDDADAEGRTILQVMSTRRFSSASDLVQLLALGSDLDRPHDDDGCTMIAALCVSGQLNTLRTLAAQGWLDTINHNPCKTQGQRLFPFLRARTYYGDIDEFLELLLSLEQNWHAYVKPSIKGMLEAHQQLPSVLATLVISYMRAE